MKQKTVSILILVTLAILLPFANKSNALTYFADISQTPVEVYEGETITIQVEVLDMAREEEIISARLSHSFNGVVQTSILSEQSIPMRESSLTFIFGPFAEGDIISYKIYLVFMDSDSYDSEWVTFTVQGGSRPLLTVDEWSIIIIAAAIVIAVAVFVIYKIRGRKT